MIRDKAEGGPIITIKPPTAKNKYIIWDESNDVIVEALVKATAPLALAVDGCILYRNTITIERQGKANDIWEAEVEWGLRVSPLTFDTTGGTAKVTEPFYRRARYAAPGENLAGLPTNAPIGHTGDGEPEGVDIVVPSFAWTETHTFHISQITFAYAMTLYNITGRVNNAAFRGFAAGEVLFKGASGGNQKNETEADVQFNFEAQPNVTGLTVGEITGISKYGWDYLWCLYSEDENGEMRYKKAKGCYIDQVYKTAAFSALGIGTN